MNQKTQRTTNPMKKSFVCRVIIIAAVALTCAANAANIGFVKGNGVTMSGFDAAWTNRLTSQGYTVTIFNDNTPANDPTLATMNLILVSQSVGSGTYLTGPGINLSKPILTYEYGLYDDIFGATGNSGSTGYLTNGITILSPSHPLAAGLSGNVSIYSGEGGNGTISKFTISSVSSGTQVIAASADVPTAGLFAVLPAGAIGASGQTWPAVRIALPCYNTWDPNFVTANGWKLLDNAITYALIPEPSSLALMGLGVGVFLARRQRR
jgi:hypothetical protein